MAEYLAQIEEAVYDGDEDLVKELVEKALEAGEDPEAIIQDGGVAALNRLGDDFNNMIAFLPELMIGGECGKSLVATQLAINGYQVIDLGTDVPTNKFIDTAMAENADIIAVSSLLTTSQYYMEELINRLTHEGKRDRFKVAVGGGPIGPEYAQKIGADGYSRTAGLSVKMADRLMTKAPGDELVVEV